MGFGIWDFPARRFGCGRRPRWAYADVNDDVDEYEEEARHEL